MAVLPGLALAIVLALGGQFLSQLIGVTLMGLPKSPISAIMMAILLGIIVRNTLALPEALQPGIRFGLVRVLRAGRPFVRNVCMAFDAYLWRQQPASRLFSDVI